MITFHRADTITFDITGSGNVDLDACDFTVFLYNSILHPECKITKGETTSPEDGTYRITIGSEVTKSLPTGKYCLEVFLKGTDKHVLYEQDFIDLKDSVSKFDA